MNIIANFHEDFIDLIFAEIDNLKKLDFLFDDYSVWKPKKIDYLRKRIELLKSRNEDYSFETKLLDDHALFDEYRRDMVHNYFNLRHKIPSQKPRKIFKCTGFNCPDYLRAGFDILLKKIEHGKDLLPHLSRKIMDPVFFDYMFYDYGLVHFHLGINPSKKNPLLIEGTKEIVYALLNEESCYLIRIDDHGKWDDIVLLEELKKYFPEVLNPWKISGEPLFNPTKEERKKLLKSQINSYIEIGGENYMAPGMGVNTVGTSTTAVMIMNHWFHHYARVQDALIGLINKNKTRIESDFEDKLEDMDLKLVSLNPIIVMDKINNLKINYDPNLGKIEIYVQD
jgi:hypothetical protein